MSERHDGGLPAWVIQRIERVDAVCDLLAKSRTSLDTRRRHMPEQYWDYVHHVDKRFLDVVEKAVELEAEVLEGRFWRLADSTARLTDIATKGMTGLPGLQTHRALKRFRQQLIGFPVGERPRLETAVQQRFAVATARLSTDLHVPMAAGHFGIDVAPMLQWLEPEYSRFFVEAPIYHRLVIVESLRGSLTRSLGPVHGR